MKLPRNNRRNLPADMTLSFGTERKNPTFHGHQQKETAPAWGS
jgi:hypothetical protein